MSHQIAEEELYLWRCEAIASAKAAGVLPAEVDWLLHAAAGVDTLSLRLLSGQGRSPIQLKQSLSAINKLWGRRLVERLPLQYLVGYTHWRHFTLKVTPAVLIPRPETECLIDLVLQAVKESSGQDLSSGNWVDLGTGSGAIALGLAEIFTYARVYGVDSRGDALEIARENAIIASLAERIAFYQGSWWEPLEFLQGKVSGMVSNPPYIPTATIPTLQIEVAKHEPLLALDGGKDGLEHIRYLIQTAPDYLVSGGIWLIEMMAGQAEKVALLLEEQGSYRQIQIFSDLAGIARFALAYRC
ncbi:MAG: peptide chain release factor N(5)-glutamine methyltransferase [Gomphosphaeria aponina SAG 52.96 = DSM 107014]|uniref:Release factor glutamine methyltransferase n=1 Tax=Gomphosphaeria aponina SAG 52.96 = DSM 107014 TaxID=1521640 RepID=A0A941GRH1_9CHRO|nr:peptide chain release factor N(5)-glutamine methyltransferase [Gomphosphaeria aponina SAG 52.96 = DSM 107014]